MKTSTVYRAIAILAVCAMGLAAVASAKNPVERPLKVRGQNTVTIDVLNGTWEFVGSAVTSHAGLCATYAAGYLDENLNLVGTGVAIGANGDQTSFVMPGSTWYVQFAGGTGRFENATGGWNLVSRTMIDVRMIDEGTISMTYSFVGEGKIKY